MWADHAFSDRDLDRWADDILEAALPLSTEGRSRLLDASCRGSDALRARVEALLTDEWPANAADVLPLGSVQPGAIVNECVILARIGSGGSGEVYKAIDTQLPRRVAVKVLSRLSADQRAALRAEAGNLSRFTHPNIAAVYRADFQADAPSIVMEHVSGITLRGWLKQHWSSHDKAPSDDVTLSLFQQMAAAVREVHQAGIVHADVKPENFLVAKQADGSIRVKLIDFGIATLSRAATGHVRGTPGYIAPEQIASQPADERSDVFALGVVLFEIVFGSHPFEGKSDPETLFNTVNKEPAFGNSTTRFRRVIDRALRRRPGQRYRNVDDMVADAIAGDPRPVAVSVNPLLTEFPGAIQQWLQVGSTGLVLAAASFTWGTVSIGLSVLANAACVRVLWSIDELQKEGLIKNVTALDGLCSNCTPRVTDVRNTGSTYVRPGREAFALFLASALLHEVFFSFVAVWVASKVVFFFVLLTVAAMRDSGKGIRLVPNLRDRDDYRFGLGRLDSVYVTSSILIGLGIFGFWFQKIANFGKGTDFLGGNAAAPLSGQLATLLLVVALIGMLLLVPVVASLFLSVQSVEAELAEISESREERELELSRVRTASGREEINQALEGLLGSGAKLPEPRRCCRREVGPSKACLFSTSASSWCLSPPVSFRHSGRSATRFGHPAERTPMLECHQRRHSRLRRSAESSSVEAIDAAIKPA